MTPSLFDPLGLLEAVQEDLDRLNQGLSEGAGTVMAARQALAERVRELDEALGPGTGSALPRRGRPPTIDRREVLGLYAQGLSPEEIAARAGVTDSRVLQILREEGVELRPRAEPAARELEAQQRRQDIVAAHHRGLPPREIAERLEVSVPLVYRALAEAGLQPHQTAEAARAREQREERLDEMLQLRQAGVSGAEIARRLGITEPRVVQLLREFRTAPPPRRSHEFEQRAFDILPQVESLRRDPSEENGGLTELMLNNLAEEAGEYVASLPEFPRAEMEEARWRVAFVRQQARRALEDMETFRGCQQAIREAKATALPRLVEQARRCIDRALRMLRECCPPPPRPSPLAEPESKGRGGHQLCHAAASKIRLTPTGRTCGATWNLIRFFGVFRAVGGNRCPRTIQMAIAITPRGLLSSPLSVSPRLTEMSSMIGGVTMSQP